MQAVIIALIGFVGVVIPTVLTMGTAHSRRLKRVQEELATYKGTA